MTTTPQNSNENNIPSNPNNAGSSRAVNSDSVAGAPNNAQQYGAHQDDVRGNGAHANGAHNNGAPVAPQYNENNNHYVNDHQYGQVNAANEAGVSAASTSKVVGIIALILSIIPIFFPVTQIIALVLGFIGRSKAKKAERFGVPAKGGKIMNLIAIIIAILWIILGIIGIVMLMNNPDFQQQIHDLQNQAS